MKKEEMHRKNQVLHIRSEKEVLSISRNVWVVDLKSSFQVIDYFITYFRMKAIYI